MKTSQDLNTSKDKLKQFGGVVFIIFELDPETISTHVLNENNIDHVSKTFPHNVKGWVESTIVHLLNVFHVSDVNTNFALIHEVDVKANQIVSASYLPI